MKVSKLADGRLTTRWLDTRTIEVTFYGKITAELIEQMHRDFWEVASHKAPSYALLDTSPATSFTASIRSNALRFLAEFKARGGREILGIASIAPLRMFGQALTFAAGLPLRLFVGRQEALTYIVQKMKEA